MGRLFGTDGIRGIANAELTPELALALGRALVILLRETGLPRPTVLVGRDPRWSGELLESALMAGVASAGGDATAIGVLPTPGVAYLTATCGVAAGAVISASHNPVSDNGIKVFGGDGFKLTDAEEERLEELVREADGDRPTGTKIGRICHDPTLVAAYVEHLVAAAEAEFHGLRVVLDASNGAASHIAPLVYRRLGAELVELHCSPDGANINAGVGSTHPEVVAGAVVAHDADIGLSHDGDADRLIAAAADGSEIDGDSTLAILALARKDAGSLRQNLVVTTIMTNLGFKRAMQQHDIDVVETKVGDRYVLEAMRERGAVLGGEQSGHLIQLDEATTGDGILTAVKLLSVMRSSGRPLAELAKVMTRLPQVLTNVHVADRTSLDRAGTVWEAVRREQERLEGDGRVLVRPSGTEPLVRIMVEAPSERMAADCAQRIATVVRSTLNGGSSAQVAGPDDRNSSWSR
ncbi:MAG: phosphoglucosamine mutase [Actinomycetota bacterium]|nr:phosphoglucosamine mutase [Actinomycetota bacterium]